VFLPVPAHPGSPGQRAVKRSSSSLLLLLSSDYRKKINSLIRYAAVCGSCAMLRHLLEMLVMKALVLQ